jgi:protein ImuB
VSVAAPTRDVATLVELGRLALEHAPPVAPVVGLGVQLTPARARPAQLGFFEPAGPSPEKLATTLAHLAALVGPGRVGSPVVRDRHLPDAFSVERFAPQKNRIEKTQNKNGNGNANARALGLQAVRPPRPAEVHLDCDRPRYLRADGAGGQVLACAGPFRVRDGWWEQPVVRDYYDLELSDGAIYRVYHDLIADTWFVDGWYE